MPNNNQYVVYEWVADDRFILESFDSLAEAQEYCRNHSGSDVEVYDPELFNH